MKKEKLEKEFDKRFYGWKCWHDEAELKSFIRQKLEEREKEVLSIQKEKLLNKVELALGFSLQNSKPLKSYTIDKEEWNIMKKLL